MRLQSTAFAHGEPLPRRFTCDGENLSPPLRWTSVPAGTKSLAIVCSDPVSPKGIFYHWAMFDLPANLPGLTEGQVLYGIRGGVNDFGKLGYGGPCPARGHGTHQYVFELFALPTERLDCGMQPTGADVARVARSKATAVARLTGLYAR